MRFSENKLRGGYKPSSVRPTSVTEVSIPNHVIRVVSGVVNACFAFLVGMALSLCIKTTVKYLSDYIQIRATEDDVIEKRECQKKGLTMHQSIDRR